MAMSAVAVGKGGGVLDQPVIEKTTPGRESEFDLRYGFFKCEVFAVSINSRSKGFTVLSLV